MRDMSAPSVSGLRPVQTGTAWTVLLAISLCHMINDVMQSMLAAIYPLLRQEFMLSYTQIGIMTLAFQVTASLLQPAVGAITDRHPQPRSLSMGMAATFCGVLLLAFAGSYPVLLAGAMLIGVGSAVFHPESSRVARLAAGGRFGTAQSLFQLGGNFGQSLGPLLAAFIVVPLGRPAVAWFALAAALGTVLLYRVGAWAEGRRRRNAGPRDTALRLPRKLVVRSLIVLIFLTFSKNIYGASMTSYFTFFTIEKFAVGTQTAQLMLFLYLLGTAAGVMLGGIIGDRVGALRVIWFSILGVLPFTLLLPHVGLVATAALAFLIGLILASAFPAIIVYAQQLVPGRTGTIAGLFFGFAFGMGGISAAALGVLADTRGIDLVFTLCSVLPALGVLAILLPRQQDLLA